MRNITNAKRRAGFTLIELLIVVAIIAILAAIAVPNFLEAQVRSKVSRALADLRTLATALESYHIEYKAYPTRQPGDSNASPIESWRQVTTPIAYITSVPEDPFYNQNLVDTLVLSHPTMPESGHKLYYYWNFQEMIPWGWYGFSGLPEDVEKGEKMIDMNVQWITVSWGPDHVHVSSGGGWISYDPTNGTLSDGNIYRLGPGNTNVPF